MVLFNITVNYLFGLVLGFYTGMNRYKIIFIMLILILIDILLISNTVTVIGGSETVTQLTTDFYKFIIFFEFLSVLSGFFTGMWLKEKSKKEEIVK